MPHTSITKPMFITNVRTTGGGRDLAKGELAIVLDKSTANGAKVVSDFAGVSKRERIEIRVGRGQLPTGLRIPTVAFQGTGFFPLESIIDIKAYAPTNVELRTDRLELGFNGLPSSLGLNIPEGKSAVMDVVIYGHPLAMFFGQKEHIVTKRVFRKIGQTMQEVVRKLVRDLKEESVPTTMHGFSSINDKLSNYLNFKVIDSTNKDLSGLAYKTSTVTIQDAGESNDLAEIQVQYPGLKVIRTDRRDGISVYSIMQLASATLANAVVKKVDVTGKGCKNCQAGYSLLTGGVVYNAQLEDDGTDLTTTVGALPGFIAGTVLKIGNDSGIGTYSIVLDNALTDLELSTFVTANPTAVLNLLGDVKAVCSSVTSTSYTWVAGETCFGSSEAFNIMLPDTDCGTSRLAELQLAYPQLAIVEGESAGKSARTITLSGTTGNASVIIASVAYSQAFVTDLATTATSFVSANAAAILAATGAVVTSAGAVITVTSNTVGFPSVEAVAGGLTETIGAQTNTVVANAAGCKRMYSTSVLTNIECDDCSDIFASPFYAEAPQEYKGSAWKAIAPIYNALAKMGIVIEGKPFTLVPERYEQDMIPFVETSTKIKSASFGFREQDYLNFTPVYDVNIDFAEAVKVRFAQDINNLSQNFLGAERMGNLHYTGETQYKNNLFARANFSQESLIGLRKRLVQYHVKYQDTSLSQMGGGRSNITHDFMLVVEQGKHQPLETILNKLAGRLGLENVSITN